MTIQGMLKTFQKKSIMSCNEFNTIGGFPLS